MKLWLKIQSVVILALFVAAGSAFADRLSLKATVSSANGQVEWLKAGSTSWQPVSANQQLESGDQIRTGKDGEATLTMEDGTKLQLFAGSEFTVQSLAKDTQANSLESIMALSKGKIQADVTPRQEGSTFEIETPYFVTVVKGTSYSIFTNPDGSVNVKSGNGAVDLVREGEIKFLTNLDDGDEAKVENDASAGTIRITGIAGSFTVTGPDGTVYNVNPGDVVVLNAGAATFIALGGETNNPGSIAAIGEVLSAPLSAS